MRTLASLISFGLLAATPLSSRAEWRRLTDLQLNTAYTLEEASLSVGLFSPLSVGVTDSFQASVHPLLLLLGQPSLALRLRITALGDITTALNLSGGWSLIDRETRDGSLETPPEGEDFGFPGRTQLTQTTSFHLSDQVLLSVGNGFSVDFLSGKVIRGSLELHASVHYLPTSQHMLMAQVMGYLPLTEAMALQEPSAQFLYAWAPNSRLHVALGVGLGDWVWQKSEGGSRKLLIFPIFDLWFHF